MHAKIHATLAKLTVPITGLTPYGSNPRRGDVDAIARSLEANGQYKPIVVRAGSNEVLAGNHTLAAAKQLGWRTIAATFVDVDDDTAARIVLIDNRANDVAGYDETELERLLLELRDLEGTGYTQEDLERLATRNDKGAGEDDGAQRYAVMVICHSEAEHERVYTALLAAGHELLAVAV